MSKERYRPKPSKRLRRVGGTTRSLDKSAIEHQLDSNDLLSKEGTINHKDYFADLGQKPEEEDPSQEVVNEVGISLDVLQVFAQEQARVPVTNGYALLDNQYPVFNSRSPRDIISDDYSENSRP